MSVLGYHASHEQFAPSELLACVQQAEAAGFGAAMCSDHLFPWLSSQAGGVGFAYAWLGAALHATRLPFGVVSAPGQRYHPAVLAQAAATLNEMFPDRFWLAVGSGEASNEHVTGDIWPEKPVRQARLGECVEVMRALWSGETVSHDGLVRLRSARVYTTASRSPALLGAAVSEGTARWVGSWADGMVTVNQPHETLRRVVDAFREGGGADKPVHLQYHLSWAPTGAEAAFHAHDQWRHSALGADLNWDLEMPEQFDAATATVRPDDLRDAVPSSADPDWHAERIAAFAGLGFEQILLHNVGPNQREFIDVFGDKVLPALAQAAP
jgi:coenzyme F420-dependent glucose-6-phosphate dehydrogenase